MLLVEVLGMGMAIMLPAHIPDIHPAKKEIALFYTRKDRRTLVNQCSTNLDDSQPDDVWKLFLTRHFQAYPHSILAIHFLFS